MKASVCKSNLRPARPRSSAALVARPTSPRLDTRYEFALHSINCRETTNVRLIIWSVASSNIGAARNEVALSSDINTDDSGSQSFLVKESWRSREIIRSNTPSHDSGSQAFKKGLGFLNPCGRPPHGRLPSSAGFFKNFEN